jgi:hypothetical protein
MKDIINSYNEDQLKQALVSVCLNGYFIHNNVTYYCSILDLVKTTQKQTKDASTQTSITVQKDNVLDEYYCLETLDESQHLLSEEQESFNISNYLGEESFFSMYNKDVN